MKIGGRGSSKCATSCSKDRALLVLGVADLAEGAPGVADQAEEGSGVAEVDLVGEEGSGVVEDSVAVEEGLEAERIGREAEPE
jgi:hypothetical protein